MSRNSSVPVAVFNRALFGGCLADGYPMRYVYIDEAGTSAKEDYTVVVGVIIKPDAHWRQAEEAVLKLYQSVPPQHRKGFLFHSKAVWGSKKYRDGWSKEERLALIGNMAALPVRLGLSVAVGVAYRDAALAPLAERCDLSLADFNHMEAFIACAQRADLFLRERCDPNEIAIAVCEDIPEKRRFLKISLQVAEHSYVPIDPSRARPTKAEMASGVVGQRFVSGVTHIKDGLHFAAKADSVLLQLADACAFAIRRFLNEQEHGEALVRAMGADWDIEDWRHINSADLLSNDPRLRLSPVAER